MPAPTTVVWFRNDLRVDDHPALTAAIARGNVIPLFIWSPDEEGEWPVGAASRWWLNKSLIELGNALEQRGSRLTVRAGQTHEALEQVLDETNADAVYWNRRYEPASIERDRNLKTWLKSREIDASSFNGQLLVEPWEVQTGAGKPYQVFTPFWKTCLKQLSVAPPTSAPATIPAPANWPDSVGLEALKLQPTLSWADGFSEYWQPGAEGAADKLTRFLDQAVGSYKEDRNIPSVIGSSRLSPHLHFGEISIRRVWHATLARERSTASESDAENIRVFKSELGWREFAHHVLFHFPRTESAPLRPAFGHFDWTEDDSALKAWQRGLTGYPIVDAGMRELWQTGWMHNRVRMITGSFLAKDLMISWQKGAEWFWDTLVDASLPNNTLGWQWISGCGADAAPYFRIFNPVSQGKKFDPDGAYVSKWIPELAKLPPKWIHCPWEASEMVLQTAGVVLGSNYPKPMCDHGERRKEALDRFAAIKGR